MAKKNLNISQTFDGFLSYRAEAKENGTLDALKDKIDSANDEDATSKLTSRKRPRPLEEEAENSTATPTSYDLNDLKTYGAPNLAKKKQHTF